MSEKTVKFRLYSDASVESEIVLRASVNCSWKMLEDTIFTSLSLPKSSALESLTLLDDDIGSQDAIVITEVDQFWKFFIKRGRAEKTSTFLVKLGLTSRDQPPPEQQLPVRSVDIQKQVRKISLLEQQDLVTNFHQICKNGDLSTAKSMIDVDNVDKNAKDSSGQQAIHFACMSGNLELVQWLVSIGAQINARDDDGTSPLHIACAKGHIAVLEWMLTQKVFKNNRNKDGMTPLLCGAYSGHLEAVQLMIKEKAFSFVVNNVGNTALHLAYQQGHTALVDWLISAGMDTEAKNKDGNTPAELLNTGVVNNQTEVVVAKSAEQPKQNTTQISEPLPGLSEMPPSIVKSELVNSTPKYVKKVRIIFAYVSSSKRSIYVPMGCEWDVLRDEISLRLGDVSAASIASVKLTNDSGADVSTSVNNSDDFWKDFSEVYSSKKDVFYLVATNEFHTEGSFHDLEQQVLEFHTCSQTGDVRRARDLVRLGVDIQAKDPKGRQALHFACMKGDLEFVTWLFNQGITLNTRDEDNMSALHYACLNGHVTLIRWLLTQNVFKNNRNTEGMTPLLSAASAGHTNIVQLLIAEKALVFAANKDGNTALHLACLYGHKDLAKWLVNNGMDESATNKDGKTPFDLIPESSSKWDESAVESGGQNDSMTANNDTSMDAYLNGVATPIRLNGNPSLDDVEQSPNHSFAIATSSTESPLVMTVRDTSFDALSVHGEDLISSVVRVVDDTSSARDVDDETMRLHSDTADSVIVVEHYSSIGVADSESSIVASELEYDDDDDRQQSVTLAETVTPESGSHSTSAEMLVLQSAVTTPAAAAAYTTTETLPPASGLNVAAKVESMLNSVTMPSPPLEYEEEPSEQEDISSMGRQLKDLESMLSKIVVDFTDAMTVPIEQTGKELYLPKPPEVLDTIRFSQKQKPEIDYNNLSSSNDDVVTETRSNVNDTVTKRPLAYTSHPNTNKVTGPTLSGVLAELANAPPATTEESDTFIAFPRPPPPPVIRFGAPVSVVTNSEETELRDKKPLRSLSIPASGSRMSSNLDSFSSSAPCDASEYLKSELKNDNSLMNIHSSQSTLSQYPVDGSRFEVSSSLDALNAEVTSKIAPLKLAPNAVTKKGYGQNEEDSLSSKLSSISAMLPSTEQLARIQVDSEECRVYETTPEGIVHDQLLSPTLNVDQSPAASVDVSVADVGKPVLNFRLAPNFVVKKDIAIPSDCSWDILTKLIANAFDCSRSMSLVLRDVDGDDLSPPLNSSQKFWKFLSKFDSTNGRFFSVHSKEDDLSSSGRESMESMTGYPVTPSTPTSDPPSSERNVIAMKPISTTKVPSYEDIKGIHCRPMKSMRIRLGTDLSESFEMTVPSNCSWEELAHAVATTFGTTTVTIAYIILANAPIMSSSSTTRLLDADSFWNLYFDISGLSPDMLEFHIFVSEFKSLPKLFTTQMTENKDIHNVENDKSVLNLPEDDVDEDGVSDEDESEDDDLVEAFHLACVNGDMVTAKELIAQGITIGECDTSGLQAIHFAVISGNLDLVKYLTDCGADLNVDDNVFMTPFHYACELGHLAIVKWLIQQDVIVNSRNADGLSPLMSVATAGLTEVTEALVGADADLKELDNTGRNAAEVAAASGHKSLARYLNQALKGNGNMHNTDASPSSATQSRSISVSSGAVMKDKSVLDLGPAEVVFKPAFSNSEIKLEPVTLEIKETESKYPIQNAFMDQLKDDVKDDLIVVMDESRIPIAAPQEQVSPQPPPPTPTPTALPTEELEVSHTEVLQEETSVLKEETTVHNDDDTTVDESILVVNVPSNEDSQKLDTILPTVVVDHTPVPLVTSTASVEHVLQTAHQLVKASGDIPHILSKKLCDTCVSGDVEAVEQLIQQGAVVNGRNRDGTYPLHVSCKAGLIDVVKLLLQSGADAKSTDSHGVTALHLASEMGHFECMELLLAHGSSVTQGDNDHLTPLHYCCLKGLLEAAELLLAAGADVNATDKSKNTPLHFACMSGCFDLVEWLVLEAEAQWEVCNTHGQDALEIAVNLGYEEIADFLEETAIEVTELTRQAELDRAAALVKEEEDLKEARRIEELEKAEARARAQARSREAFLQAQMLEEEARKREEADAQNRAMKSTELLAACSEGDSESAVELIGTGADVNITNANGSRPLHFACASGHFLLARDLVLAGAQINAANNFGSTALHVACDRDQTEVVLWLVSLKTDLKTVNHDGYTPLHYICIRNNPGLIETISQSRDDFDPNMKGKNGYSLFHCACEEGASEIAFMLIELGAEINMFDNDSRQPIHYASRKDNLKIVRALLKQSANINAVDKFGWTPLFYACQSGDVHLARYLVSKGAKLDVLSTRQDSCLHITCQAGDLVTTKWLVESGLDVYAMNAADKSPFDLAVESQSNDLIRWLKGKGASLNPETPQEREARCRAESRMKAVVMYKRTEEFAEFQEVCTSGDLGWLNVMLRDGLDPNIQNSNGSTGLHFASSEGHLKICKRLVEGGAFPDTANNSRHTPFHCSCRCGHLKTAQWLVTQGGDYLAKSIDGRTALHYAASNGHAKVAEWLLGLGMSVDCVSEEGFTPLYDACMNGHLKMAKHLANVGADITIKSISKLTMMHAVCTGGHLEVGQWLAEEEAPFDESDNSNMTPFLVACRDGHLKLCMWLLGLGVNIRALGYLGNTALHLACQHGHSEVASWLLDCGLDINAKNDQGFTSQVLASNHGYKEVCEMLDDREIDPLERKKKCLEPQFAWALNMNNFELAKSILADIFTITDPEDTYPNGSTLMHLAAASGHLKITQTLIDIGSDVNALAAANLTPLHYACGKGHLETAQLLFTHGALATEKDHNGNTVLHLAAEKGHGSVVNWLAKDVIHVDTRNSNQSTPLHIACLSGHVSVVKVLITLGAHTNAKNAEGLTPIHCACIKGHMDAVVLLASHGGDIFERDSDGQSAIDIASKMGYTKLSNWLHSKQENSPALKTAHLMGDTRVKAPIVMASNTYIKSKKTEVVAPLNCELLFTTDAAHIRTEDTKLKRKFAVSAPKMTPIELPEIEQRALTVALCAACVAGNIENAKSLISKGAEITASELPNGDTPLHLACAAGHLGLVKYIAENGGVLESRNHSEMTPLLCAADNKYVDIVLYLLRRGADPTVTSKEGFAMLHYVSIRGLSSLLEKILDLPPTVLPSLDLEIRSDPTQLQPLHCGAKYGFVDIVKVLIGQGVQMNPRDDQNCTPLHYACLEGHFEVAAVLLSLGAFVNCRDNLGFTPLLAACAGGHLAVAKLLVASSAATTAETEKGDTALHLACAAASFDTVLWLLEKGADTRSQNHAKLTCAQCVPVGPDGTGVLDLLVAFPRAKQLGRNVQDLLADMNRERNREV